MKYFISSVFTLIIGVCLCFSPGDLFAQCSTITPKEAVFNGDFEKGYLTNGGTTYADGSARGFTVDPTFPNVGDYNPAKTCYPDVANKFAIGKRETCGIRGDATYAGDYLSVPFSDHTPGKGGLGFAFITDYNAVGGTTKTIWSQNITVSSNQIYYMSAYFARYNKFNGWTGAIAFYARGNVTGTRDLIKTVTIIAGEMVWEQFFGTWNSGSNTTAIIDIDFTAGGGGDADDIALDDISFINGCDKLGPDPTFTKPDLGPGFSICRTNGTFELNSLKNPEPGRQFTWYSVNAANGTQTTIVNPSFTESKHTITQYGTYRVCVSEPGKCAVSDTIRIDTTMSAIVNGNNICNPATTTISATVTPALTTGTYTYAWTGGKTNPGNVNSFVTDTASTYQVTVRNLAAAGCKEIASKTIISNIPKAPTGLEYCDGGGVATALLVNGKIYSWYRNANGTNLIGTNANGTTAVAWTPVAGTTGDQTVYIVDPAIPCVPVAVIVKPKTCCTEPIITTQIVSKSVCDAAANVTLDIAIAANPAATVVRWEKVLKAADTVSTNAANFISITNTTKQQLFNSVALADSGWYRVVAITSSAACRTNSWWTKLSVRPKPTVDPFTAADICSGDNTNITLASTPSGATFSWVTPVSSPAGNIGGGVAGTNVAGPITQTLTNTTAEATLTYKVAATLNGCTGATTDIVQKVNPRPTVNAVTATAICSKGTTNIALVSTPAGATFSWLAPTSAPAGAVTGGAAGTSVSGPVAQTLENATTAAATLTYNVTATLNGCTGASRSIAQIVNPLPVVNPVTTTAICSADNTNIPLSSTTSGTVTYTWSAPTSNPAGAITGGSAGTDLAGPITDGLTNTTDAIATLTYAVKAKYSGCEGPEISIVQTVNPTPTISSPLTDALCSGGVYNYEIKSLTSGATFAWSRALVTNVTPATGSGATNMISETLTSTNAGATNVTYVLTPSANNCTGTPANLIVSVGPAPTITSALTANVCSGIAQNYTITASNNAATLTWDRAAITGISNTASSAQTSNPITEALVNTTVADVIVTYKLTPALPGCIGISSDLKVTVHPSPVVTITSAPANGEICIGKSATLSGGGAGNYVWDNSVADGMSFSPTATNTYTVIGTDANGCKDTAKTTVKVDQLPVITNTDLDQVMCGENSFSKLVVLKADTANSTYTYTASATSPQVAGYATVNGGTSVTSIPAEAITSTSSVQETVSYVVTVTSPKGCVGASPKTFTVKVDPVPDQPVFADPAQASTLICKDFYNLVLNPMTIGTLTWTSDQSTATFSPSTGPASTTGSTTMNGITNKGADYMITATNRSGACPDKPATVTIKRVDELTNADAGKDTVVCYDAAGPSVLLTGNNIKVNETSSWTAHPDHNFNPVSSGMPNSVWVSPTVSGSYRYIYTISNGVCPDDTNSVLVTMLPEVDLTSLVTGTDVCALSTGSTNGQIHIVNPQPGTTYTAKLSASDPALATVTANATSPVPLPLTINESQLPADGSNTVLIYGQIGGDCPQQLLINQAPVTKVRPVASIAGVPILSSFNDFPLDGTASIVPAGGTYQWDALSGGTISGSATIPLTQGKPSELISSYQLTVGKSIDGNFCFSTAITQVEVKILLEFPNVFSPNEDGVHDFFVVKNSEFFHNASMEIFNQWGDKVYVKKGGYYGNWDGKHNSNDLPVATYYYVFTPNQAGYDAVAGSISILR